MKHYALGLALLAATPAAAQDIGISLSNFDDVFFTASPAPSFCLRQFKQDRRGESSNLWGFSRIGS